MIDNSQTLLNTILLNLKIVCHLSELDFIKNFTKNSDFRLLSDITVDQYQSDKSESYIKYNHTQSSKLTTMEATSYFCCSTMYSASKINFADAIIN